MDNGEHSFEQGRCLQQLGKDDMTWGLTLRHNGTYKITMARVMYRNSHSRNTAEKTPNVQY